MKSSVRTGNLLRGALLAWVCAAVLAQVSGAVDPDLARDLAAIDPARHIERLASIPSRVTGYEGCTEAEQYIFEQYRELGLANIKLEPFQIIVPVDKGAELRVGEAVIPLRCVWPNGVRTSKTTESGVTGPLIWAGDGELNEFNGKDVDGSIVLMNFNTATRWLDAAKLGARAIIFLEPRYAFRSDAEQKYLTIPVPVPRYYLERKHFATLAEAVLGGPLDGAAASEGDPLDVIADLGRLGLPEARATVVADMIWEEVTANMVSGELPGTDPELGEEALVLHAYYDSASVVPALAPGAESACGIAAQLEIGAFLLKHPPRRTVKLLATPGHFQALAGARHYAFKYVFPRRAEELKARGLPEEETSRGEPFFFIGLDLSSRQRTMAGFYKGHFYDQLGETGETDIQRIFSDYSSLLLEWADEVTGAGGPAQGLKFQSGIVPLHGRKWRALLPDKMAFDAEVLGMSQRPAITLATTGDNRGGVNTPLDTYAMLEPALENVRAQAILCALIVKQTADTPILPTPQQMNAANVRTERLGSIFGRAIEQTLSAYIPQQPVPDAVAVAELSKVKTMMGVQGLAYVRTDVQGLFEIYGFKLAEVVVNGFVLSPSSGVLTRVAAPGLVAARPADREEWELRRTDVRLNFFQCVSTTVFDLFDPLNMRPLTSAQVLRGDSNSAVRYLVSFLGGEVLGTSYNEGAAVFCTQKGLQLKILFAGGPAGNDGMLLNMGVELARKEQRSKHRLDRGSKPQPARASQSSSGAKVEGAADAPVGPALQAPVGRASAKGDLGLGGVGYPASKPENFIYRTAYQIAMDTHLLDYDRLLNLERTGIRKKNIWDLHGQAYRHLLAAERHFAARDYSAAYREVSSGWALENRVYPDVRGTSSDVVKGVIFYFALLLPFVIFAERLLVNYADIRKKLVAIAALFVISYATLMLVHPAFRLSQAPIIILNGFFMMVASLWTIWYLTGRFQSVMESIRRSVDTIHRADVARSSAAMAAFVLGISNMRKRKIRTFLTAATLILLTFTILSFTSFETMPAQMLRRTSSDPAPYVGVLVRRMSWDRIGEMMGQDLSNFFRAQNVPVALRSWFVSREQTQELKLDVRKIDPARPGASSAGPVVVANAMLGLSPEERLFSGLGTGEYLQRGKWFSGNEHDWPFVCVLPRGMFENLAIEPDRVTGDVDPGAAAAYVSVLGRRLRVVGVLDSQKFTEYKDLDRETLTPVDFQEQQYMEGGGAGGFALTSTGDRTAEDFVSAPDSDEEEVPYVHMDPDRVLIVPHELCMKLGGTLRAIVAGPGRPAVNPSGSRTGSPSEAGLLESTGPGAVAAAGMIAPLYDGTPSAGGTGADRPSKGPLDGSRAARPAASFERIVRDFVARVTLPLYEGTEGGKVARLATRGRLSVGGLKGLVVPILIAALIVFNTMLGAVYERVTEIKVYAAVGLAPIHIASLFFAESCVFAVVGAMCGYLLGQVVSFGLMRIPWLMAGISLNYSSVSAVWSALLVIAIVIASTAYPAHMAGKLSVPDETRKMIIQRPTSDIWKIRFPFTVSSKETLGVMGYLRDYFVSNNEDSVGAFTADNITYYRELVDSDQHIFIEADVWVAPLDMGISQHVKIASVPDLEEPEITYLFFTIERRSGEFATWGRMNAGFLKDLRRQLLIWRLVTVEAKARLTEESRVLLGERSAPSDQESAET